MWHVWQPSTAGLRNGSLRYNCRNCGIAKAGTPGRKKRASTNSRVIGPPPSKYLFEPHSRNVRVPIHIEAPGLIFVFPGVIDSDARTGADRARIEVPIFDPNRGSE